MAPKKPYKILFVHSSDEMYGADLLLKQLVTHLDRDQFDPLIVLPDDVPQPGLLSQSFRDQGLRVISLKMAILRRRYLSPWGVLLYLGRFIYSTLQLSLIIHREKIDLVHSHTTAVLPGAAAAYITRTPHLWQTLEIIVRPRILNRLLAWLLPRWSITVVAASEATRAHLCASDPLNEKKSVTIHFGLELASVEQGQEETTENRAAELRREWGIEPGQPLIGMVGRISRWKGQDYLIRVARLVNQQAPEARFALAGGTFYGQESLMDDLEVEINRLGLNGVVMLLGYRRDIPAVLAALDIFVSPSILPDPFPTVVLEAMAAGKPVVANAHGGPQEMIVHGENGLLVPPGQPDAMAAALVQLIDHPDQLIRMGQNSRSRLLQNYTLDQFLQKWYRLYESTIYGHNPVYVQEEPGG